MSKYLIKTIKLPDYINSGDHLREEDWLYVDPDKINTINILGKEFIDSSVFEPVKHGRWMATEKGAKVTAYKCSECGRVVLDDTGYDVSDDYPYCHCGAKMDEVENGI